MVFWPDAFKNHGHVAIHVGQGSVMTTMSTPDSARQTNKRMAITTWIGAPAGFVAPDAV